MAFPQTRLTLIQRLAGGGAPDDWQEFLNDYWGPVCRFARARGNLSPEDAEDVASETLAAVVKNNLLARWSADRSAKLRTLLCAVVRNVLSNRARIASGRDRLVRDHAGALDRYVDVSSSSLDEISSETKDAFYRAWAEDIVEQAVEGLFAEYNRAGKGDYFRVLFGRLCEEMTYSEIAAALKLTPDAAESHYRQAKARLCGRLEDLVRGQVRRYCSLPDSDAGHPGAGNSDARGADGEFEREWSELGDYLKKHGGLEAAVRRVYGLAGSVEVSGGR